LTVDGHTGDLLTVASSTAAVVGVGGQGSVVLIRESSPELDSEFYLLDAGSGYLWGYDAGCRLIGEDIGEYFLNYTCSQSGIWKFVDLDAPHMVELRTDPKEKGHYSTWWHGDRLVLDYLGDQACLAQVSNWAPECVEYSDLGYVNGSISFAETREDGLGRAAMEWRIGFIPLDCIWSGPEGCPIRWYERPMSNLRFSDPGVWLPDGSGLLLLEEPGSDKGVQRLRVMDPLTGEMRFIGAYPKPFIDVLHNRGVAIQSPDGQIVVDRRFADEYSLLSLENGMLTHLIGEEGEELHLNSNGLLRVP